MGATVLGAVAAVTASVLFSAGLVLQAAEARRGSGADDAPPPLARLARRPRWVGGCALMLVGFGLHATALGFAPLTVVQPALAAGLLLLLVLAAREDGEPVRRAELAAVAGIAAGLVGLTLTAPERTTVSASAGALALVLGVLGAAAFVPLAPRHRAPPPAASAAGGPDRRPAPLFASALALALAAGGAYALTGISTKLFSDALSAGRVAAVVLWLSVTAAAGVLALLDQTRALLRGRTTQVGAILYVVPVVVPVVLAPVLVGERWSESPLGGVPLALSLMAVCAGAAVLGGSRRIAAIEDGGQPAGSTGAKRRRAQSASSSSRW